MVCNKCATSANVLQSGKDILYINCDVASDGEVGELCFFGIVFWPSPKDGTRKKETF